jgi:S-adenosylmethionine:tRNA ribosyltransferase-isomerase
MGKTMGDSVFIKDYDYNLTEGKIAQSALEPRDSSKLLVYKAGQISDAKFSELPEILEANSSLFFNDAKVIPARIFLKNSNGATIEVFLLQPFKSEHVQALNSKENCRWTCLIGNKNKWKHDEVLEIEIEGTLAQIKQVEDLVVEFTWKGESTFVELLEKIGKLPLPPYIKHEANEHDKGRYQTVYSKIQGSVAAPTAGLHFTDAVLSEIKKKSIAQNFVTLHVSAGTFLPVKVEDARAHHMHQEIYSVNRVAIESILKSKQTIAVGTTSIRVLESLYWAGVNLIECRENPFKIEQFVYEGRPEYSLKASIEAVLQFLNQNKLDSVYGQTSIMVVPGYEFKVVKGLITNFHQPKSTLLLLISALLGDNWKKVYAHALDNGYRFLSYGDSSLLLP